MIVTTLFVALFYLRFLLFLRSFFVYSPSSCFFQYYFSFSASKFFSCISMMTVDNGGPTMSLFYIRFLLFLVLIFFVYSLSCFLVLLIGVYFHGDTVNNDFDAVALFYLCFLLFLCSYFCFVLFMLPLLFFLFSFFCFSRSHWCVFSW